MRRFHMNRALAETIAPLILMHQSLRFQTISSRRSVPYDTQTEKGCFGLTGLAWIKTLQSCTFLGKHFLEQNPSSFGWESRIRSPRPPLRSWNPWHISLENGIWGTQTSLGLWLGSDQAMAPSSGAQMTWYVSMVLSTNQKYIIYLVISLPMTIQSSSLTRTEFGEKLMEFSPTPILVELGFSRKLQQQQK